MKLKVILILINFMKNFVFGNITVALVYDSLDSKSVDFLTKQFRPNYETFKGYVYMMPCPFGQAKLIEGRKVDYCLRGPTECYINFLHLCANTMRVPSDAKLTFVYCTMTAINPVKSVKQCAIETGFDYNKLIRCLPGAQLIVRMFLKRLSKLPVHQRKSLPIFYYKEQYFQDMQYPSTFRFFETVCSQLGDYKKPPECIPQEEIGIDLYWFIFMVLTSIVFIAFGFTFAHKITR